MLFILKIRPVVLACLQNQPSKAAEMLSPCSYLHGFEGCRSELQLLRKWKVALALAGLGMEMGFKIFSNPDHPRVL